MGLDVTRRSTRNCTQELSGMASEAAQVALTVCTILPICCTHLPISDKIPSAHPFIRYRRTWRVPAILLTGLEGLPQIPAP